MRQQTPFVGLSVPDRGRVRGADPQPRSGGPPGAPTTDNRPVASAWVSPTRCPHSTSSTRSPAETTQWSSNLCTSPSCPDHPTGPVAHCPASPPRDSTGSGSPARRRERSRVIGVMLVNELDATRPFGPPRSGAPGPRGGWEREQTFMWQSSHRDAGVAHPEGGPPRRVAMPRAAGPPGTASAVPPAKISSAPSGAQREDPMRNRGNVNDVIEKPTLAGRNLLECRRRRDRLLPSRFPSAFTPPWARSDPAVRSRYYHRKQRRSYSGAGDRRRPSRSNLAMRGPAARGLDDTAWRRGR